MGLAEGTFKATATGVLAEHIPELSENTLVIKPSKQGKYLSITATFTATSQKQLDDLYQALSDEPHILMVL